MQKHLRRQLFYLLFIAFMAISPLIIAHSLGYTFDFSKLTVGKTGGIFIKSKVPRLSIFLNNIFWRETSFLSGSALLTGIKPGIYLIRVEKEGFHSWSKGIEVEPSIVLELRDILLIKNPASYATTTQDQITPFMAATSTASSRFRINKNGELIEKSTKRVIASKVNSFEIIDDAAFFIDTNGFLARFDLTASTTQVLGHPEFNLEGNPIRFERSSRGEFIIMDQSGETFFVDREYTINPIGEKIVKAIFDNSGDKALLIKEHGLEVFWTEDNSYQPFQKKFMVETVFTGLNSRIHDAGWFYGDNAHVVLRTDDGIFITEVDGRGGRSTFELVPGRTNELITLPEFPQKIFFRIGKLFFNIEI